MKKIKRIIAREGLIVLGLAVVLYFVISFLLQNIPVVLPQYRVEFSGGEVYIVTINPEIRNDSNYRKLLEEAHDPAPRLIEKRIKEFARAGNIRPVIKSSSRINSGRVHLSGLYSRFLGTVFILKLIIAYFILLLIRFIIWAIALLKKDPRQHSARVK